jgi:hypothetical protein
VVLLESLGRLPGQFQRAARLLRLGVAVSPHGPPHVDGEPLVLETGLGDGLPFALDPRHDVVPTECASFLRTDAGHEAEHDVCVEPFLADRARADIRVRILLGKPDSPHVAERRIDEGIKDAITAKIQNALTLYRALIEIEVTEVRLHSTTLYASIYRADDDLFLPALAS